MSKSGVVAGFVILTLWGAAGALAQTATQPPDKGAGKTQQPAPPAPNGVTVFVDPVTRQIRQPSASEIGELSSASQAARAATAPAAQPQIIQGPGGAVGILLDDSAMSFMVATKKPDGKLAMECVTGNAAAASRTNAARQNNSPAQPGTK